MKNPKDSSYLSLSIMVGLGVFLLLHPGDTLVTAATVLGIGLILIGGVKLVFRLLGRDSGGIRELVQPVIEVVLGILVCARPGFIISLYPVVAGLILALYGVSDILGALGLKRLGFGGWRAALVLAAVTVLLGVVIMANPFGTMSTLVRVLGVCLIYRAIVGIFIKLRS